MNGKRFFLQQRNDLRYGFVCIFSDQCFLTIQSPGKIDGSGTGRIQIFFLTMECFREGFIAVRRIIEGKHIHGISCKDADDWCPSDLQQLDGIPHLLFVRQGEVYGVIRKLGLIQYDHAAFIF